MKMATGSLSSNPAMVQIKLEEKVTTEKYVKYIQITFRFSSTNASS